MTPISDWIDAAPLVIAHRGASSRAPENTLPAFELAAALGAEAVELDVKLSRDGQVIVLHDQTLRRTTGQPGRPMDYSGDDLARMDAGSWMAPQFAGIGIPRLDEVLDAIGRSMLVDIELTEYTRPQTELVEAVAKTVRRHRLERRVLLSSFDSGALGAARRLASELPLAHLRGPTWLSVRDLARRRVAKPEAVHLHVRLTRPESVQAARRAGRRLHVYTVDDPMEMARLWAWGVHGLITDEPDVALRQRDRP